MASLIRQHLGRKMQERFPETGANHSGAELLKEG